MNKSTRADRELVKDLDGLFIGQLDKCELESLDRCVADGVARKDYGGIAGQFGLGKVKWIPQWSE